MFNHLYSSEAVKVMQMKALKNVLLYKRLSVFKLFVIYYKINETLNMLYANYQQ